MDKDQTLRILEDIFQYEANNRNLEDDSHDKVTREEFWRELYVPRENEENILKQYLKSNCTFLFVSGHVGCGKSTLIRSSFEKYNLCKGLIIDLSIHIDKFLIDDQSFITKTIENILSDAVKSYIKSNIKYSIINQLPHEDMYYAIDKTIISIDPEKWNDHSVNQKSTDIFYAQCLLNLSYDESILAIHRKYGISGNAKDEFLINALNIIKDNNLYKEIEEQLNYQMYINLLRNLYSPERS